jgi:integrase
VGEEGRASAENGKGGVMANAEPKKLRGIYEKVKGSGIWWVRYCDSAGRLRREKAGTRSMATTLYQKRKTEALQGKKLPETLRHREATFSELVDDALAYSKEKKRSYYDDKYRLERVRAWFGDTPAGAIRPREIEAKLQALSDDSLSGATINRFRALLSLVYRQGMKNEKVDSNPARLTDHRKEDNARTRFLYPAEEEKLRAIIQKHWPDHEPELDIALHTGLRRGSMYRLAWADVDFERGLVREVKPKKGKMRYIPLNPVALAAFLKLRKASPNATNVFDIQKPRHWFEKAIVQAEIVNFHWHDLRHTFASRLTMLGVPLKQVQELMGHTSIVMTARYSHLAPAFGGDAVARLAGFGKPVEEAKPAGDSSAQTDTTTVTGKTYVV